MIKLDGKFLNEVGLGKLPAKASNRILTHSYQELERRIVIRLFAQMSPEQAEKFAALVEARDTTGAFRWLGANYPGYARTVYEEFACLKRELAAEAEAITAIETSFESNHTFYEEQFAALDQRRNGGS